MTFVVVFFASLLMAWLKQPHSVDGSKVEFTTLIAVGYKTPTVFLEPLNSIKTQLESAFIPIASEGKSFDSRVEMESRRNVSEDGSNIVKLITIADREQREQVAAYHNQIVSPLLERHNQLIYALKEQLLMSPDSIQSAETIHFLGSSVAALTQPLPASPPNNKSWLIVTLGVIFGGILAVIVAFLREFASKVCDSLDKET